MSDHPAVETMMEVLLPVFAGAGEMRTIRMAEDCEAKLREALRQFLAAAREANGEQA